MENASLDPELTAVVAFALALARDRGFREAGTHQLLLAAIRTPDSAAHEIFRATNVALPRVVEALESAVFSGVETRPGSGDTVLAPKARRALGVAVKYASGRRATSAHMILGIPVSRSVGGQALLDAGLTREKVRVALDEMYGRAV